MSDAPGQRVRVGLRLPTLASQQLPGGWPALAHWAAQAEELGYDSVWCVDHLLAAQYTFGAASLEPVVTLAHLAGATRHVQLGVSVLIAPLRHRTWLAKQLGTLSAVAGNRVLLGVGAGWDNAEFQASDVDRRTRGARLDAVLDDLLVARERGSLQINGHDITPAPSRWGAIVVGGGSSATVAEDGRPVGMATAVARRIARADGWFVRSSAAPDQIRRDLGAVRDQRAALGVETPLTLLKSCFLHVAEADSDERALDDQLAAMGAIGWGGDRDTFAAVYPHGTVDRMAEWFRAEAALGVSHLVLHPVGPFEQQLERLTTRLLPQLSGITALAR